MGRDQFNTEYETVAVSQSDQVLGGDGDGALGDLLERLIVSVATSATGAVSLRDGSGGAIPITAANTPIGVYVVEVGARTSNGAWKVTTGAGATVIAIGDFS